MKYHLTFLGVFAVTIVTSLSSLAVDCGANAALYKINESSVRDAPKKFILLRFGVIHGEYGGISPSAAMIMDIETDHASSLFPDAKDRSASIHGPMVSYLFPGPPFDGLWAKLDYWQPKNTNLLNDIRLMNDTGKEPLALYTFEKCLKRPMK